MKPLSLFISTITIALFSLSGHAMRFNPMDHHMMEAIVNSYTIGERPALYGHFLDGAVGVDIGAGAPREFLDFVLSSEFKKLPQTHQVIVAANTGELLAEAMKQVHLAYFRGELIGNRHFEKSLLLRDYTDVIPISSAWGRGDIPQGINEFIFEAKSHRGSSPYDLGLMALTHAAVEMAEEGGEFAKLDTEDTYHIRTAINVLIALAKVSPYAMSKLLRMAENPRPQRIEQLSDAEAQSYAQRNILPRHQLAQRLAQDFVIPLAIQTDRDKIIRTCREILSPGSRTDQ